MGVKVSNNAFGTLSAGINTSDTTITLDSGQGARFPTLGAGDYFFGTIVDTSNNLEIVKVTARSSDSMTVVRGQDDTTATAFAIGDRFELRPTAALFNDIIDNASIDGISSASTSGTAIDIDSSNNVGVNGELDVTADVNPVAKFSRGSNNTTNVNFYYNTTHTGQLGAANGQFEISAVGASTPMKLFVNGNSRLEIGTGGIVTMPNQPSMLAQPNSGSNVQVGTGDVVFGWYTGGTIHHLNGFTLSANGISGATTKFGANTTGKITVPEDGRYIFQFDMRCESASGSGDSGAGQLTVWVNGTKRMRRHANHWGNDPYTHEELAGVLDLSENDTLHFGAWWNGANQGGPWSGYNDTVNWLYIAKIS